MRRHGHTFVVRGDLHAMALHLGDSRPELTANGSSEEQSVQGGLLKWKL
jgi:hypothetical protein